MSLETINAHPGGGDDDIEQFIDDVEAAIENGTLTGEQMEKLSKLANDPHTATMFGNGEEGDK